MSEPRPVVFISYSRKDEKWKNRLVQQLAVPAATYGFDVWHDEHIEAGDDWKPAIERALQSADVAVLLVSGHFLTSQFVMTKEVPELLKRRAEAGLVVIPVIVSPCLWKHVSWLEGMQVRPDRGQPLSGMTTPHDRLDALARIAEDVAKKIRSLPKATPPKPAAPPPTPEPQPRSAEAATTPPAAPPPAARQQAGTPQATEPVPQPFSFVTVTLNERGQVVERRHGSALAFAEDLGEGVTLEMVAIPAGTFTMGSPDEEEDRQPSEGPQRRVTVAPFWMGQFPVTQAQWRAVALKCPRVARDLEPAPAYFPGEQLPVEQVSWHDAVEFCARLTNRTGRHYRLPTEAEWEYAARAGTTTPFHFGPTLHPDLANYDGAHPYGQAPRRTSRTQTTPVGSFGVANTFGLFDVHGNVWEWVEDVWHDDYSWAPADGRAWNEGGDATRRVLRGGSWFDFARNCRAAFRGRNNPEYWFNLWGFRVVCSVSRTLKPGAL